MSDPSATTSAGTIRLLISLATYNEAGNLRPLVETIREFAPACSILIIDDNSPDGTGQIADEIRESLPDIHVIHRAGKLGLGTATLAAMRFAIEHKYDYLLNLDADFSHPPRFIPDLLKGMADHDVMIGSRYVPGGGVEGGFTLKRRLMSGGINAYARLLLGLDQQGQQRRVSLLSSQQAGRDRSRAACVRADIRSRKRFCTGARRSAAGSAKRRSCSRTAARAARRSTCAKRPRRCGSCFSSAFRAGRSASERHVQTADSGRRFGRA